MNGRREPIIIQGGMGVAVSNWQLARAVSLTGQLGVVSGTALDIVLLRRLQLGDPGGHMRRALAEFPYQEMAERIIDRFYIDGGKPPRTPFALTQLADEPLTSEQLELMVAANFAEVYLAKEGHDGLIGINYLEKIQLPTLPSLFGAMLAGVDYVLMGAGIPQLIPGVLDRLSHGEVAELPLRVTGAVDHYIARFDPEEFTSGEVPWLMRPRFLPIVSSSTLATMLARKSNGRVDGFVVEGPTAGGHNAPPRGKVKLNSRGEPIYGTRDMVDLQAIRSLALPFWLAGSYGSPGRLHDALREGATGIQVGTAFAFCEESGLRTDLKRRVLQLSVNGRLDVFTDSTASPARFPFKVLRLEGTLSDASVYQERRRRCDLGFLRQGFRRADGRIGWRCPAEDVSTYTNKGGDQADTWGRKCLCNCLLANVGLGQYRREGGEERPLLTCGDEVQKIARFLEFSGSSSYSARDVVECLISATQGERGTSEAISCS